jgi:hypothetical protein
MIHDGCDMPDKVEDEVVCPGVFGGSVLTGQNVAE